MKTSDQNANQIPARTDKKAPQIRGEQRELGRVGLIALSAGTTPQGRIRLCLVYPNLPNITRIATICTVHLHAFLTFFISAYLLLQALLHMAELHQIRVALLYTAHFVGTAYARHEQWEL